MAGVVVAVVTVVLDAAGGETVVSIRVSSSLHPSINNSNCI